MGMWNGVKKSKHGNEFKSFEEFDFFFLNEKEVLNFFKKAVWTTFHHCKITNFGNIVIFNSSRFY